MRRALTWSAQRLSASLESSPFRYKLYRFPISHVLNAFRHHWNLHITGSDVTILVYLVLNAFRHHWNLHTANGTTELVALWGLNSFRHHWNLHQHLFEK